MQSTKTLFRLRTEFIWKGELKKNECIMTLLVVQTVCDKMIFRGKLKNI